MKLFQAGGYLAEPQNLQQMEFLTGLAGLEADFTGIRYCSIDILTKNLSLIF